MNLEEQKLTGINQVYVSDSLEAPLLKVKITNLESTTIPTGNELIVYVDKQESTEPTDERKQFVYELEKSLQYLEGTSDEFILEVNLKNNDVVLDTYVERKIGTDETGQYLLSSSIIEEIDGFLINLFKGTNYIYTNYTNASLEVIYSKNDDLNKRYLNNAVYYNHKINNDGEFGLDDIYFKDAFTKTEDKLNLEVNNAKVECITSKNNTFSLDENGNLVVNSITANSGLTYNNESICNLIYPVGSIYLSVSSTDPSLLFGGTWSQLKDRFLLGAGDTYNAGVTGGEASHTLTISELPSHGHDRKEDFYNHSTSTMGYWGQVYKGTNKIETDKYDSITIQKTGGDQPHNNMPPYVVVYMWRRIA